MLNKRDRELLREATLALLSPLEDGADERWCARVNRLCGELLRADFTSFLLPSAGGPLLYSGDFPINQAALYGDILRDGERSFGMLGRQLRLGVFNRRGSYGSRYEDVMKSWYYHDFIVPIRAFDAIGITARFGGGQIATLLLHHNHPTRRQFGRRGLSILRVLEPAFRAGTDALLRMRSVAADLGRTIDELDSPVTLLDQNGAALHRSAALMDVLSLDPEASSVYALVESMARQVAELARGSSIGPIESTTNVATRSQSYDIRVWLAPAGLVGRLVVVASVRPRRHPTPSPRELQARFALTAQEARVALLLAQRKRNAEIAEILGISPHTSRRHTERVLQKLGVSSRLDVATALSLDIHA